ncbi:MAG TPA: tetratricopeptide repeat-containing protein [Nevskiaceae bacterium]|nr:tetratricopeptide repeat-containing protein [Nevskiaceae bacterium]
MKIGVTGPLLLDASQRQAVIEAVSRLVGDPRWPVHITEWTLCSGMAPGADLLLVDALRASLRQDHTVVKLEGWLAKSPDDLRRDWKHRARSLGRRILPSAQNRLDARRTGRLADARIERLDLQASDDPYRVLGARLALETDLLIAVINRGAAPGPGGSAEVLRWRRHPDEIPEALRARFALAAGRALVVIDPDSGRYRVEGLSALATDDDLASRIRRRIAAGNALAANDLAAEALQQQPEASELRYLFLQSLAACGNPRGALERYESLAPPAEQRGEDWWALRARLHKDLAFAGEAVIDNLRLAAELYEAAFRRTGGSFSAINAASLALLEGDGGRAAVLARAALQALEGESAEDPRQRYFRAVTRAEALAVLGEESACAAALAEADPLLRDDLVVRSRTRGQIARVLQARGRPVRLLDRLAMPDVYLLTTSGLRETPRPPPGKLAQRLSGSPVYTIGPTTPAALAAALQLLADGVRLHLVLGEVPERLLEHWQTLHGATAAGQLSRLIDGAEQWSVPGGFLGIEAAWREQQCARQAQGVAAVQAARLGVPLRRLSVTSRDGGWQILARSRLARAPAAGTRRMVGLVFSDMVGFSRFSDAEIRVFWTEVMPRLAEGVRGYGRSVLLKQTWGDAMHLVTADARTAAQVSLDLVRTVRRAREAYSGRLGQLEIRVGVHYAPAYAGHDPLQDVRTFYGSQLSFTARVEPVTPPGQVFATESLSAELELECPGQFRLEYAGDLALAKQYGRFRLYSLRRAQPD